MLRCADVAGRDVIVPANTFAATGSRFYARIRLCCGGGVTASLAVLLVGDATTVCVWAGFPGAARDRAFCGVAIAPSAGRRLHYLKGAARPTPLSPGEQRRFRPYAS